MLRTVFAAASIAAGVATAASASSLHNWNLIVFNDLTSNSEVEGRALVGRDLHGPASNYGTLLTPRPNFLGTDVLVVGRNITSSNIQMEAGNLRVGGTVSGNVNFNGGGQRFNDAGAGLIASAAQTELQGQSAFLRDLAPTNTVTIPNGQPGPVTFNAVAGGNGVAVFNVNGNALLSSNLVQQIDLLRNGVNTVIINVSGTAISYNGGNMVGGFSSGNANRILWNFHEATTLNVDRQLFGAVLAPYAALTNSTTIVGSTAALSFNQNGEVHLPQYDGFIPSPGALAVLGMAGGDVFAAAAAIAKRATD